MDQPHAGVEEDEVEEESTGGGRVATGMIEKSKIRRSHAASPGYGRGGGIGGVVSAPKRWQFCTLFLPDQKHYTIREDVRSCPLPSASVL